MKGSLYQLLDVDGNQMGLIYTEDVALDNDMMSKLWEKWYIDDDGDTETFAEYLQEQGYDAERVFTEEINP